MFFRFFSPSVVGQGPLPFVVGLTPTRKQRGSPVNTIIRLGILCPHRRGACETPILTTDPYAAVGPAVSLLDPGGAGGGGGAPFGGGVRG